MPEPNEDSRLLAGTPMTTDTSSLEASIPNSTASYEAVPPTPPANQGGWGGGKPSSRPVNINIMKRNMSVAKGFIDICLLTANASQLKHLIVLGDPEDKLYYLIYAGLVVSILLQVVTGILLILKERFDLDVIEDHASAELYNDIVLGLVFATLALNVFISSLGVTVMERHPYEHGGTYPEKHRQGGFSRSNTDDSLLPRIGGEGGGLPPTNASTSINFNHR